MQTPDRLISFSFLSLRPKGLQTCNMYLPMLHVVDMHSMQCTVTTPALASAANDSGTRSRYHACTMQSLPRSHIKHALDRHHQDGISKR